jgi:hypothetical protein
MIRTLSLTAKFCLAGVALLKMTSPRMQSCVLKIFWSLAFGFWKLSAGRRSPKDRSAL